jgi:uncharacterized protein HemY
VVDWIVIAIMYVLVLLLVRFLGGIASAGEAMQKWGAREGRRWQRTHPRGWR